MPDPHSEAVSHPSETPIPYRAARSEQWRAVGLLFFMVFLMAGTAVYLLWARGAFDVTQPLYLTTDDSDGVLVGMDMTFSGFPIGRVRRIELAEGGVVRIQVDVPVKDAHWLRSSSIFTLERGLVGAARLRAFTGVMDDAPLEVGAERSVLRGDVSAEIPRMVADARDVLQNVNHLTSGTSILMQTMTELNRFTARLNSTEGGLMAALTGDPEDARRVSELLEGAGRLVSQLDETVTKADRTLLTSADGLVTDARGTVGQLDALLADLRHSLGGVDALLDEMKGLAGNARAASENLGELRADVEASLRRVDALVSDVARTWPFAPKEKEVTLP